MGFKIERSQVQIKFLNIPEPQCLHLSKSNSHDILGLLEEITLHIILTSTSLVPLRWGPPWGAEILGRDSQPCVLQLPGGLVETWIACPSPAPRVSDSVGSKVELEILHF